MSCRAPDAATARVLDTAIRRHSRNTSPDYRRAVETRMELAVRYQEADRAAELRRVLDPE